MESGDGMTKMGLVRLCIEAATESSDSIERWRRQRRTLERMPPHLANDLFRCLLQRRLLFPSLLEVFQYSVEEVDLKGETKVDAEWTAYLGAFRYLRVLNLAGCKSISSAALWPFAGMTTLTELNLSRCCKVTDSGMEHLLSNKTLEKLYVSETKLTSNGVTRFSMLRHLHILDLGGLPVTDSTLVSLQELTQLSHLDIWGSKITDKGASILKSFKNLSFLNIAWTNVNELPDIPSLVCLNMSYCSIHSLFNGKSEVSIPLSKLWVTGAQFDDVNYAFSHLQPSCLSFLDLSQSSVCSFNFLIDMKGLQDVTLSFSSLSDESMDDIAAIGMGLKNLDISNTKITSQGVSVLSGHVPNLETLSLSNTAVDDSCLSCLGIIYSLRMIDLSNTKIRGIIYWGGNNQHRAPSLTPLLHLQFLETLNLEETPLRDEALYPLSNMKGLKSLSLKSDFLSDNLLYVLSSLRNIQFLGFRGAVLTNSGLDLFEPPASLAILDLRGCWLLTEDLILLFCRRYPKVEVKHDIFPMGSSNQHVICSPQEGKPLKRLIKGKTSKVPIGKFADERIKYSRMELLELQFSNLASSSADIQLPRFLMSKEKPGSDSRG